MKAVLEDACLDVVPLLAFVPRDGFRLPPYLGAFNAGLVKVSVSVLDFLCFDGYLPLVILHLVGRFHLYIGNEIRLGFLVAGLCDVDRKALHFLASLTAVGSISVIRVLHAV